MKMNLFFVFFIFTVCLLPQTSQPCTTFCIDKGNQLVVGSNLDTFIDDGLVFVNKRNMSKRAHLNPYWGEKQPVNWKSKYGSVTFNIAGREFPFGGMNEAGLVVTSMWLEKTEFPKLDSDYTDFDKYKVVTGNDAHSLFVNPEFADKSMLDLHVQSTSPAIDASEDISDAGGGTCPGKCI